MSAREWKPGDVALIHVPTSSTPRGDVNEAGWTWLRAARWSDGWAALVDQDYYWSDGYAHFGSEPRPLVVIDPESLEDQEALAKALVEAMYHAGDKRSAAAGVMPATVGRALNALADPKPRIEEPTGLGAVVRDAEGAVLVRTPGVVDRPAHWADMSGSYYTWADLDVAEILHEGWSE